MNLHEYQSKTLLSEYGVAVPEGHVASTAAQAVAHAERLGGAGWAVKAQVHAGGRGKAGGVKLAHSVDEVREIASGLIGTSLVTHQTGAAGQPVNSVLVEALTDIAREFYLSMLVDRASRKIAIIVSAAGGMDIETVAATQPDKVATVLIDPATGLSGYHTRRMAFTLSLDREQQQRLATLLARLFELFVAEDLSLLELNPLALSNSGDLIALDAKLTLDDNALFRHPALAEAYDVSQEDEKETRAKAHELNYIALDGNIACMVNGAGLAMATMDLIKLHGGEPANFLDVGGGTTAARVSEAFKLILSDAKVKAILVNIFGGIVRCDLIAEGIITAVEEVGIALPVVVRLEGTNVEQGKALLQDSGLNIISAADLTDAAQKVVAAAS